MFSPIFASKALNQMDLTEGDDAKIDRNRPILFHRARSCRRLVCRWWALYSLKKGFFRVFSPARRTPKGFLQNPTKGCVCTLHVYTTCYIGLAFQNAAPFNLRSVICERNDCVLNNNEFIRNKMAGISKVKFSNPSISPECFNCPC
jgi:hypothetical protein